VPSKKLSIAATAVLALFVSTALITSAAQTESVLRSFNSIGIGGYYPYGSLISDSSGNLYGTTSWGGTGQCTDDTGSAIGCGTVFELTPAVGGSWTEKVLYSFPGTGQNGDEPEASLIFDASGNLYGTTYYGGLYGDGVVFELSPRAGGEWTETVLHSFGQNGTDGALPCAGLVFDAAGNLYGTTNGGGAYYYWGTVFELTPHAGGEWTETILHSFNDAGTDGWYPLAGLVIDSAGNLYGTTYNGGVNYYEGTVFELTPTAGGEWTETVIHSFDNNGTDGNNPFASLTLDSAGNLYGTTIFGGAENNSGAGTVFELTPGTGGNWTETILRSFNGSTIGGRFPRAGVILDASGNLYGTTTEGGTAGFGTVFELTPKAGGGFTEKLLHSFGANARDGKDSLGGLLMDSSGNLYGTTYEGGAYTYGAVFKIKP
jgi:uncharacterized repeat protein (TIGR03803 family)